MKITYHDPIKFLTRLVRSIIRPRPRLKFWEWADKHVVIPADASSPIPGRLNTGRLPIFRGLYDLAQQPHVHFITLCASIRVGKTLFSIVIMLYWIAEKIGSLVWLDPSGSSAKKVSRGELDPFIRHCEPANKLAIVSRTTWTSFWKTFRGKNMRIVGSGEEANLHGFNAELAIINEFDRCKEATIRSKSKDTDKEDSSSADKIAGRTLLYPYTRKIIENSSPGMAGEFSPIWQSFLRGSQHHCYLPCPHCTDVAKEKGETFPQPEKQPCGWSDESMEPHLTGWQRLTFSISEADVPFDEHLLPLAEKRKEKTGQIYFEHASIYTERPSKADAARTEKVRTGFDFDIIAESTSYECAHCRQLIPQTKLGWMLRRYRWLSHNPGAPKDRISAHVWRAYAPPELGGGWNLIAKDFLECRRDVAKLISFHNFTLGLPFIRSGIPVTAADIDKALNRTPHRYIKGQLPRRPLMMTIAADKQRDKLYYTIRAWGIIEEHPDLPTWSALVDWGEAVSMDELTILAGERVDFDGKFREFSFTDPQGKTTRHRCLFGLIDSGDEADRVYEFCLKKSRIFDPYKGGGPQQTRWNRIRESKVYDDQLTLWLCWSSHYAERLYTDCIKTGMSGGEPAHWWLPIDIDDQYREQLTDEYKEGPDFISRKGNNHLGDCEKMQLVLGEFAEARIIDIRAKLKKEPAEQ